MAPSTLAVVGRYVLTAVIFDELEQIGQGAGGEIQLTDGIARLLQQEPVFAHRFNGRRFDCGNKLGYLQATVELSLAHPALGQDFRTYLRGIASRLDDSPPRDARSQPTSVLRYAASKLMIGRVQSPMRDGRCRTPRPSRNPLRGR